MADRFCGNCGQELRPDARFCGNCGKATHEVAHVPTPEADVPVPPLPPQQGASPAGGRVSGTKSTRNAFIALGVVGLLIVGVLVLAAIPTGGGETGGGENGSGGGNGGGGNGGQAAKQSPVATEASQDTFTNENYSELYSDPDAHEGARVNVAGQLLERPEDYEDELAFQMFVDMENADWNTIVYTDQTNLDLDSDDYVRVEGEVLGAFEGENAFGGSITAPSVQASKVSTISVGQAIDPAQKVVEVGQTLGDQGFEMTLDKIEFGEESTRAYVKMANNTGQGASFYTFDTKIQQGSTQVDYLDDYYDYYDEEPQSEIRPGVETEGVLPFGPVDPNEPFELIVPWSSDNYNINVKDIVFQITP